VLYGTSTVSEQNCNIILAAEHAYIRGMNRNQLTCDCRSMAVLGALIANVSRAPKDNESIDYMIVQDGYKQRKLRNLLNGSGKRDDSPGADLLSNCILAYLNAHIHRLTTCKYCRPTNVYSSADADTLSSHLCRQCSLSGSNFEQHKPTRVIGERMNSTV